MRLSALRDTKVRTLDGKLLGRVHEVHCKGGKVTALMCGPASLIERLTAKSAGRRIPWQCVRKVEPHQILVTPDPPQRKATKASAARSRPGTRRPSAPRSER
ncbi:MAG: PRC-barrel domain-containing protein [Sphingomonas sp.]